MLHVAFDVHLDWRQKWHQWHTLIWEESETRAFVASQILLSDLHPKSGFLTTAQREKHGFYEPHPLALTIALPNPLPQPLNLSQTNHYDFEHHIHILPTLTPSLTPVPQRNRYEWFLSISLTLTPSHTFPHFLSFPSPYPHPYMESKIRWIKLLHKFKWDKDKGRHIFPKLV